MSICSSEAVIAGFQDVAVVSETVEESCRTLASYDLDIGNVVASEPRAG
jgi:hypothetical protein